MIIHNFHVRSVSFFPHETDPPLMVDANAVLTFAVTFKFF